MTLPAGTISLSQVNVELLKSSTALISLNDTNVRSLAGVASGAISMSNLQGKTNKFAFTISADVANINLRTVAVAAGWDQVIPVEATIGIGVNVYSTSTGTYALTIDGTWANGVTLINNGNIFGKGGRGGDGGTSLLDNPPVATNGTAGSAGGPALTVASAVSINNTSGVIGGGGGGGGGGAGQGAYLNWGGGGNSGYARAGGGGGGGGAGVGSGGSGNASSVINSLGGSSTNGGIGGSSVASASGAGGANGTAYIANNNVINYGYASCNGGDGGAGGSLGTTGTSGASTGSAAPYLDGATGGSGGSAGACLTGNTNITWIAFGTRYGAIS